MKLTTKHDIEAPIGFVFAELSDFDFWERAAMRRGADVSRMADMTPPRPGMEWQVAFDYRNKPRKATIRLDEVTPETRLHLTGTSALIDVTMAVDLLQLAARRTRVQVWIDLLPKTLSAKIYVQSLRLARGRMERSFATRVGQFAADIEARAPGANAKKR